MKTKECPFCFKDIGDEEIKCPHCGTTFKKSYKAEHICNKHSCGAGDQARRSDSEYQGGYVD